MSVDADVLGVEVWSVEHNVVGWQELALGHYFETQAKNMAAVDCVRIGVMNFERCDRATGTITTLLNESLLLIGFADEFCAGGRISR